MTTQEFANLLANRINCAGEACDAVARKINGLGWCIVDDGFIDNTILFSGIKYLRRFQEYRVGMVSEFVVTSHNTEASRFYYVGPSGCIID